jgi:hypothetical protein
MSAGEFRYWRAYDRMDPIGEERHDFSAGIVASTMANCHRSKDADAYTPSDFMWQYKPAAERDLPEQTPEEVAHIIGSRLGAMVLRNKWLAEETKAAQPNLPCLPGDVIEGIIEE